MATRRKRSRPRGRPRQEDVAALEARLFRIALGEFVRHGYGGASLGRIVRGARISKTTLYSRFESKAELFAAIMRQQIELLAAASSLREGAGAPDLERGLKAYANRSLAASLEPDHLAVNRLIYSESHRFAELGALSAQRTHAGTRKIAEFIRECAAADGLGCRDPESVAEAYILMLRGWYLSAMLNNRPVSKLERERWVERAVHALVRGRKEW
jgi:TetR/AcrR family transcriptional regulator, mexJK operon transcriptional repressor